MRGDLLQVIFFAVLAGFLIYRLFSTLGRREGFEREEQDFTDMEEVSYTPHPQAGEEYIDPRLRESISLIKARDLTFRLSDFLQGAQAAFKIIVEAYATGDVKTLKSLLTLELYRDFEEAVQERKGRGETLETKITTLETPVAINASIQETKAQIRVKFISEQQHIRRDQSGKIIEGDPKQTEQMTDLWTFERDLTSGDPNWTLVKIET